MNKKLDIAQMLIKKDYIRLLRAERDALRAEVNKLQSEVNRYTELPLSKGVRLAARSMSFDLYNDPNNLAREIDGQRWVSEHLVSKMLLDLEEKYSGWKKKRRRKMLRGNHDRTHKGGRE